MKVRDITAALLTAFGLGKTLRELEHQRESAAQVTVAARAFPIGRENVEMAVHEATEEAAGF